MLHSVVKCYAENILLVTVVPVISPEFYIAALLPYVCILRNVFIQLAVSLQKADSPFRTKDIH